MNTSVQISSIETVYIWQAIDLLISATTDDKVKLRELKKLRAKLRGEKE